MHRYQDVSNPENNYNTGVSLEQEAWQNRPAAINNNIETPSLPTSAVEVSGLKRSSYVGNYSSLGSLGLSNGAINVGLRKMQMTNLENYGYEALPTQYVKYESCFKINIPLGNGRSTNLIYGNTILIIEKTDYFPKGSIIKKEYAMDNGRIKFGFVQKTINRYHVSYTNNVFAKGLTWFDSTMQPVYGNQNYKSTVIYNDWSEYPGDNYYINWFKKRYIK